MGVYSAGFFIGSGVALIVGGWVLGFFESGASNAIFWLDSMEPWQATFITTGAPGVLIAFLAFLIYEPKRHNSPAIGQQSMTVMSLGDLMRVRGRVILLAYFGFSFSMFVVYAIGGWTPAYLGRTFDWSIQQIGVALGVSLAVGGISGSLLGGIVIDRLYERGFEAASIMVGIGATILSAPLLITAYFISSPIVVLAVLTMGLTIFHANAPAVYSTFRILSPPELRGRITVGFIFISSLLGAAGGPLAVGLTSDYLFHSEKMVGASLATVLITSLPIMAALLVLTLRSYQRLQISKDDSPLHPMEP